MSKIKDLIKANIYEVILIGMITVFILINIRINLFSYNNFDFGKFDLGNMSQMLWNTTQGRFMYLTDYFGTNLPRWGMSHVDPILLLLLPIFVIIPHPLTLVFSQVVLLSLSALLIYYIARLHLDNKAVSFLIAVSFLFYPALGYLTARTTFHGVSFAIPFFFLAYYFMELYLKGKSTRFYYLALLFLMIFMMGKEQLSLYVMLYGLYLFLFKEGVKRTGLSLMLVGFLWFIITFFVIIPNYADQRAEGFDRFARSLNLEGYATRNVSLPNYFLSRYDAFGESYGEIIVNILLNPDTAIRIGFGGDRTDNFNKTFFPVLYIPFLVPQFFIIAVPDLMMNYLTSASGIGTSEISNHRISMIIPVLFLSVILFMAYFRRVLSVLSGKAKTVLTWVYMSIPVLLVAVNIYGSSKYNNPVYLWAKGALVKRLPVLIAEAKFDETMVGRDDLQYGEVLKFSQLENKDRDCAQYIVDSIPDGVSVSGPDYLGAHLSLRETYAIFPALYDSADYVIVDVFSRKILSILDLKTDLIQRVIEAISINPNYQMQISCGNLFVYKKSPPREINDLLPIQEIYRYPERYNYEIYSGLTVVDFNIPEVLYKDTDHTVELTYLKKDPLSDYFLFLSLVNVDTGEIYQLANLPSFAIHNTDDWEEDLYYKEYVHLVIPEYLESRRYKLFLGMSNYIKNRSVYLTDVELR